MTHTPDIWPTFDDWWNLYDYKLDRKRCVRLWSKIAQYDREKAMAHTELYAARTYTDGRYPSRRHPGTYLHNENWHDDALIPTATPAAGGGIAEKSRDLHELIARKYTGANGNDLSGY
jgi:hypothetical protein